MRKLALAVLCAGSTLVSGWDAGPRVAVTAAHADASADDCVGVRKTEVERGLEFSVQSSCEKPLACSLGWTVTCSTDKGAVTSRVQEKKKFALSAGASEVVTGSAATCKQSWRIEGVNWRCDPVK